MDKDLKRFCHPKIKFQSQSERKVIAPLAFTPHYLTFNFPENIKEIEPTMFNISNPKTIELLQTRRSEKSRRMVSPGPTDAELTEILNCAIRVPDHGKLAPWRFLVLKENAQKKLSSILADAYVAQGGHTDDAKYTAQKEFPLQAETLVVVVSKPNIDHKVPVWEQHLSVGAACQNLLIATHALGYVGQWLTGDAAYCDAVRDHFNMEPEDAIAGFIFLGSSNNELTERPRPAFHDVVTYWDKEEKTEG